MLLWFLFNQENKTLPSQVKIVEVGPRDGLQNEKVQYLKANSGIV